MFKPLNQIGGIELRTKMFEFAQICSLTHPRLSQLSPIATLCPTPHQRNMAPLEATPRLQALVAASNTLKAAVAIVAAETGLREQALATAYRRHRTDAGSAHGNAVLSREQEQVLVGVAMAFSIDNVPLYRPQLQALVHNRFGATVFRECVNRWLARHRCHLSLRACKALADKCARPQVYFGMQCFCLELRVFLDRHHFSLDCVFNYDETRIVQRGGNPVAKRIDGRNKEHPNAVSTRRNTVASLLTFISADGKVFFSVYVWKASFDESRIADVSFTLKEAPRVSRRAWPRFYCLTDTGFLDGETFGVVMDHFCTEWSVRNPGRGAFLFGDQLGAHTQAQVIEQCMSRAVFLFYLTANSSHFNQPLDAFSFASFKERTTRTNEQGIMECVLTSTSARDLLLLAAYSAEVKVFTLDAIIRSFRVCGLWPLSPATMLKRAKNNLDVAGEGDSTQEVAQSAAAAVILEATQRNKESRNGTTTGQASMRRSVLHSGAALAAQAHARQAARDKAEEEKQQRAAERIRKRVDKDKAEEQRLLEKKNYMCRVCMSKTHRGGRGWVGCKCGEYWVCPECCVGSVGSAAIVEHHGECAGASSSDEFDVSSVEGEESE